MIDPNESKRTAILERIGRRREAINIMSEKIREHQNAISVDIETLREMDRTPMVPAAPVNLGTPDQVAYEQRLVDQFGVNGHLPE